MLVRFLHCKGTLPPAPRFYTESFEGSHKVHPTLWSGELGFISSSEDQHQLLGIHLHGRCVSSPTFFYSTIYLCKFKAVDVYFILWIIILYYFIVLLKFFQSWPLRTLPGGSCVPLMCPHILLSGTTRHSGLIFYISWPRKISLYLSMLPSGWFLQL